MLRKTLTISYSTLVLLFIAPVVALACGGFFSADDPVNQSQERIIFSVNGDGTLTAVVGISYSGEADDFSWILPVPGVPEVDVAETETLELLQEVTRPRIDWTTLGPNPCQGALMNTGGLGGGGGGITQGTVGPYEYAIIEATASGDILAWLRDNGYSVDESAVPVIESYAEQGMSFVAMKLQKDAVVGDIQPVKLTYPADKPMIPIQLAAVAALHKVPITVWIFADTQYAPENYAHAQLDLSDLTSPMGQDFRPLPVQYSALLDDVQAAYDGQAFVTEFAGAVDTLPEDVSADPLLTELTASHAYLTRLRGQLAPEQMTLDPVFVPAPDLPDVSSTIDLSQHTSTLNYFNCTTRSFYDEDDAGAVVDLPGVFVTAADFMGDLHLRYPARWGVLDYTLENGHDVYIIASGYVTPEAVAAYFRGEPTPSMIVIFRNDRFGDGGLTEQFRNAFGVPGSDQDADGLHFRFIERQVPFFNLPAETVAVLLTTEDDFEANRERYAQIEAHINGLPYYAHPALEHTLLFGGLAGSNTPMYIGYNDGWVETLDADAMPVLTAAADAAVTFHVRHASTYLAEGESWFSAAETLLDAWQAEFGLSDAQIAAMAAEIEQTGTVGCGPITSPQTVETDQGETLRLVYRTGHLLIGQAPTDSYADYAGEFAQMQASANVLCG